MIWGASVIADSTQFSAAVTELPEPVYPGSALTLRLRGLPARAGSRTAAADLKLVGAKEHAHLRSRCNAWRACYTNDHMPISGSTDAVRLAALRAGDERAFAELVDEFSPRMLKLARVYLASRAAAEEAVQEAWIVVLRSLDRFEQRSSLSTWILGIVVNVARAQGRRESRSRPFSSLSTDEPALDPHRFLPADHDRWPGHWAIAPAPWPEGALETAEAMRVIREAVAALPETQRAVITLRDMIGCSTEETCNALGVTDTNQRVLLHRARTKVRAALEAAFDTTEAPA
jgi:RNA polymerase sigma-70 factor (ECF subfamily)